MKKLNEYLNHSVHNAWDDFWEPFYWLMSADKQQKERPKSREPYRASLIWKVSITLVSASLASVFICFFSNKLSQLIYFPTTSLSMPGLIAIWSVAIIRILAVCLVQQKHRQKCRQP